MKADWKKKKLGELLSIQNGYAFDSKLFSPTGKIPLIRIRDLKEGVDTETRYSGAFDKRYVVNEGDFLIGMDGEFACYEWKGNPALLNQRVCRLEKFQFDLASRFLFYGINSHLKDIEEVTGFTTVKHISSKQILAIDFLVPPLLEQHRIVTILDETFEGIATATVNAEKNLSNARDIFNNYLKYIFTNSGEGWIENKIRDVCTLKSGTSVNVGLEKPSGDFPYVKVADMNYEGNETEIIGSSRFLNFADVGKNAVFPVGTTIFPKRGGSILTNKKRFTATPICADLNIMGVYPNNGLLQKLVYYYFVNVDMRKIGGGSSIPQINNYDIEPLLISYPISGITQTEIVAKLDDLYDQTKQLEAVYQQKIDALAELKKSILHQAFTGQLQ